MLALLFKTPLKTAGLFTKHAIFAAFSALALAGCGSTSNLIQSIELGQESPQVMYSFAEQLRSGVASVPGSTSVDGDRLINKYDWAAYVYDLIERFHPNSPYAALGQLRQGESYFQEGDYDLAVTELEEFILEHPGHPQLDHAYYLNAMSAFVQISTDGLDPGDTSMAIERFERLLAARPNSSYKDEALHRIVVAQTQLAATEIRLGLTLQRQNNFEGAIARYRRVVDELDTTPFIEEALYRLVETYLSIGLRNEAELYAKILGANYPNGVWYQRAYTLLQGRT